MEFTGERVVPGKVEADLLNEHISRYYFAKAWVEGRSVLDVGCGTGYGSGVLAEVGREVLALDISVDAIAFARRNYSRPNLEFIVSDCHEMPLGSENFDAVVCFEVVEHLAKQDKLLQEIRRVLRATGVLVISTPNRVYYTEERKENNPFHVREFDFEEFSKFLKNQFAYVEMAFQNHVSSLCLGNPRQHGTTRFYAESAASDLEQSSNYFVAVCSNSPVMTSNSLIYLPAAGNLLREKDDYIHSLDQRILALEQRILNQRTEYEDQNQWCLQLSRQLQERTVWAQGLDQQLRELESHVAELERQQRVQENELRERLDWAEMLNGEISQRDQRMSALQAELDERMDWTLQLDEELRFNGEKLESLRQKLEEIKQSRFFRISRTLRLMPEI
jgi:SAM-dependent methyltransferase